MFLYSVSDKGDLTSVNRFEFLNDDMYMVDDIDENNTIFIWIGKEKSVDSQDIIAKKARELNKSKGNNNKLLLVHQGKEYGSFQAMMDKLKDGLSEEGTIERRPELKLEEPKELIAEVGKKSPEVRSGVYQWLNQLKIYRSYDESKRFLAQSTTAEPKPLQEKEIEASIVTTEKEFSHVEKWLNQLQEYREVVPIEEKVVEKVEISEVILEEEEVEEKKEIEFETFVRVGAYFLSRKGYSYNDLCYILAEKQQNLQKGVENVDEMDIKIKAKEIFNTGCTYNELCWLISELDTLIAQEYL